MLTREFLISCLSLSFHRVAIGSPGAHNLEHAELTPGTCFGWTGLMSTASVHHNGQAKYDAALCPAFAPPVHCKFHSPLNEQDCG